MDLSGDPFAILGKLAHLLDALPPTVRVLGAVKAVALDSCAACANHGYVADVETGAVRQCSCVERRAHAIDYLTKEGWREGLDVARPGLGTSIRQSLEHARAAAVETHAIVGGRVVGPDFAVRPRPPWEGFARALRLMEWASIPLFGRRGAGKTETAKRLAQVAARQHGYPVEAVNMWGEDLPRWIQPISADLLVNRMQIVRRALELPEREEELSRKRNTVTARAAAAAARAVDNFRGRVIIIDENSLMDTSPQSPERRAVVGAMMQARHLGWIVIYVGQLMNQLPKSVLTSDIVMIKQPSGDEDSFDRDDAGARHLWQRAALEFERIEGDPTWWRPPYDTPEAWTYVKARYPEQYDGMMPIRLADEDDGA